MRRGSLIGGAVLAIAGAALAGTAARADDAAECDAGIQMIRAEASGQHAPAVADALRKALRVAEREKGEKEYDECVDAVADAKKALNKK